MKRARAIDFPPSSWFFQALYCSRRDQQQRREPKDARLTSSTSSTNTMYSSACWLGLKITWYSVAMVIDDQVESCDGVIEDKRTTHARFRVSYSTRRSPAFGPVMSCQHDTLGLTRGMGGRAELH